MKVKDINEHFLSRAPWVNRANTVDRIKAGDPDKEVARCAVAWIPSLEAIRRAVEMGVDLLVCHEPTFYDHFDADPTATPIGAEKLEYLNKHGLAVLRNHDVWDVWPEVGIPWAWGKFLGLNGEAAAMNDSKTQHRHDIAPVPFGQFAKAVAARTATINEPLIEVNGDPDKLVSKIGVGTGCGCSVHDYQQLGCDCFIVCDDGTNFWEHMQIAEDLRIPVICVNHCTSEEPGMVTMTQYINDNIEGVAAEHIQQGCRFKVIGSD